MQKTPLAILTGGSRGIGRDLLRLLLEQMDVLNLSRSAIEPEVTKGAQHQLFHLGCDFVDVSQTTDCLDQWLAEHPSHTVRTFISCAATLDLGWLTKTEALPENFDRAFHINALAPIALSSLIGRLKRFDETGSRVIYVTSSLARPLPALTFAGLGLYSATKSALERLAQVQTREFSLSDRPVKVALVHPGIVATDMQRELRTSELLDGAFTAKTAGLPPYKEGDWDHQPPETAMRTISPRFAAEFLNWIALRDLALLDPYYDFYTSSAFHNDVLQTAR
ncbi:SDR family oxidoreductase [Paraburkholderia phenazinium]|uniref:NAD(P)-dependent dehydrogenase, short-chain alcohol dehydrogenase family n=1 Tax=Paraburkholderia phenazinium TaxID=60549 RepID=A0A1N6KWY5_9BURK|nr:SDR family oxidoreductase [Paraburkholderia phenazinium]SIO61052.1 NAD(P)-dependent dehydrogenase, short-chain alcohol dehydrogenase family [Paraburkholderia phenazinium]